MRALLLASVLSLVPLAAYAELAVSAHDGKQIREDKGPAKDEIAIIAFGSANPKVIGRVEAPASMIGPPTSIAVARDYSFAIVTCGQKLDAGSKLVLDDVVTVIGLDDPTKPKVLQTLHAGPGAMGVSMNRAKTLAMVAASGEGAIYVYSIADRHLTLIGKIDVGAKSEPRDVIFAPDGKNAYVVGWGNGKLTKLAINGTRVTRVGDIMTGVDPAGQAINNIDGGDISRDGRYLYNTAFSGTPISAEKTGTIAVTDLRSFKLVASTVVGSGTENLTLSPDGRYMAITILNGTAMVRSAPDFDMVLGKLKIYAVDGPKLTFVTEADTGHNCQGTAFSDDTKTILLQCATEKDIEVFRFDGKSLTRDMGATLSFGARPGAIATNKTR
jgi:hypothetical protein